MHGHPLDLVFLDPGIERGLGEAHDTQRWVLHARPPGLLGDGQPDFKGRLGGEIVKAQGGQQADHTFRYTFAGLGQRVMLGDATAGEDVKSPADPLQFATGQKQMIPAFEEAIIDMKSGEKKTIEISADDAYGQPREELTQTLDRSTLPDEIELKVGSQLTAQGPDGQPFTVTVAAFNDETVTLDGNHPLAGEDLTFDVELVEIV